MLTPGQLQRGDMAWFLLNYLVEGGGLRIGGERPSSLSYHIDRQMSTLSKVPCVASFDQL